MTNHRAPLVTLWHREPRGAGTPWGGDGAQEPTEGVPSLGHPLGTPCGGSQWGRGSWGLCCPRLAHLGTKQAPATRPRGPTSSLSACPPSQPSISGTASHPSCPAPAALRPQTIRASSRGCSWLGFPCTDPTRGHPRRNSAPRSCRRVPCLQHRSPEQARPGVPEIPEAPEEQHSGVQAAAGCVQSRAPPSRSRAAGAAHMRSEPACVLGACGVCTAPAACTCIFLAPTRLLEVCSACPVPVRHAQPSAKLTLRVCLEPARGAGFARALGGGACAQAAACSVAAHACTCTPLACTLVCTLVGCL